MQSWILDVLKIGFGVFVYGGLPLLIGMVLRSAPRAVPGLAGFMLVLTALPPGWVSLWVANRDGYRGHVRGFEISLIDSVAVGILWWAVLSGGQALRGSWKLWLPWMLYVVGATLGVMNALDPTLTAMAVWKNTKAVLPMLAGFAAVSSARDLRGVMSGAVVALLIQTWAGVWDRYVHGSFRIHAWFEHSNSLAVWCYMMALPVLAAALHPGERARAVVVRLVAVCGAGSLILMTLARASLAAFAVGSAVVVVMVLLTRLTIRSVIIVVVLVVVLMFGLIRGLDSIQARIESAEQDQSAVDFRVILNQQSAEMFRDHALVGIGWNNYGVANSRPHGAYSWHIEEWNRERNHQYEEGAFTANALTESLYWLHLAENGLAGTMPYILFLLWTIMLTMLAAWRCGRTFTGTIAVGLLVALGLAYAHGLVERVLVQPKNLAAWLVMMGAVLGAARAGRESEPTKSLP